MQGLICPMTKARANAAVIAIAAAALLVPPLAAQAEDWPSRPIRFIVPYPAGGSTDVGARVIADVLSRTLGQQIYIENKSGGSGSGGMDAAAKSAPDGYTILVSTDQVTTLPHIMRLNFDALHDLVPVIQLSRQPVVLAVHPSLGVDTLAGFVALAKARPGMSYATSGIGSQQHIAAAWFAELAGIKLEHVPYRGGGQAINDLIAGHVQVGSLGSSPLIPHYKAGTLRLLAQTTSTRSPSLAEVPTYQEAGIKGLFIEQWLGMFVPFGTPKPIADRLNHEVDKALAEPAVRANFLESAQEPVGGSAARFAQLVKDDYDKYARLTRELAISTK
jgi:tripartite-type tricarboxylate transporter receptor subunit TctC